MEETRSIHTMEYYSAVRENDRMPFAKTWMDLEIIIRSKPEKDKYHMAARTCGI